MENEVDSGERLSESPVRPDPDGYYAKMSRLCDLGDLEDASRISGRSGMTRNGTLYRLPPLEQNTRGKESGLLPTPTANQWKGSGPKGSRSHTYMKEKFYLSAVVTDSGKLNPIFVERMLGYPEGWTD